MPEDHKVFVKRIGLVGISRLYVNLRGFILLPIFIKTIGTSDYGIWTLILATFTVLEPFILLGLQEAILRILAGQSKEKIVQGVITITITVLFAGTITSIFFFFSSDFIANIFLKEPSSSYIIEVATPFIILDTLNTIVLSSFRVFGMIKKYALILIIRTSLEIGLIVFFILFGFGLIGAFLALIIAAIISLIITLFYTFQYAGIAKPDFSLIKPYLLFCLPLVPITLASFVMQMGDRYVIGFYMGAEKVGIYSASYGIATIPLVISTYLVYILGPTVYKLYDTGEVDKAKKYLLYSWKYYLMLAIPSAFGLSILAKPLLLRMTTPEFVPDGIFIIPLVGAGIVLWGMEQIFGISVLIFKHRKIFLIAFICGAGANFILNIIFIPQYGIIIGAITTLIAYAIIAIIIGYSSRRHFKFDLNLQFIAKCIIASIGMILVIWIFNPINILEIGISIIIGIIVYLCLMLLQKCFLKGELRVIFDTLGLKKHYEKIEKLINRIRKKRVF